MFANGSSALRQIGSGMKSAGSRAVSNASKAAAVAKPAASGGLESLSTRKRKKLINDAVSAHERLSAIDNANYTHEVKTRAEGGLLLSAAGHNYVETSDSRGGSLKMSRKGDYQGPNPFQQDGYYSPHTAHTDMAGTTQRNTTTTSEPSPSARAALGSSRQVLALPAGSATVYDAQAGKRPGTTAPEAPKQPFVAGPKGDVKKPGAKDLNLKTAEGPARTFTVGKQGTLHTRETTPGNETKPIAKTVPLKSPYGGPTAAIAADDTKKKKTSKKKKAD